MKHNVKSELQKRHLLIDYYLQIATDFFLCLLSLYCIVVFYL